MPRSLPGAGAAAVLAGAAASALATAVPVDVVLPARAEVRAGTVVLRDVARLAGAPQAVLDRLGALPLGPAPLPGERVALTRGRLAAHLARQAGSPPIVARWSGADRVDVVRAQQRVPAGAMREAAERGLNGWLAAVPVTRHAVDVTHPVDDALVPAGRLTISMRPLTTQSVAGRLDVWLDLRVDGRQAAVVRGVATVHAFAPQWVARSDVPAGGMVSADTLERREAELATRGPAVGSTMPLGRAVRPLAAGQVVAARDVAASHEVTRGQVVTARLDRGLVGLAARGRALQDGRHGQRVLVRLEGASAPLTARVTGPALVQVLE